MSFPLFAYGMTNGAVTSRSWRATFERWNPTDWTKDTTMEIEEKIRVLRT